MIEAVYLSKVIYWVSVIRSPVSLIKYLIRLLFILAIAKWWKIWYFGHHVVAPTFADAAAPLHGLHHDAFRYSNGAVTPGRATSKPK
jgi:hypothetical protein